MTLEDHLNEKEKQLYAIWIENKGKLTSALSLISESFPTFSMHDASHSDSIIEIMECLLGGNIENLGASDTFLLLMAAYTHDLGMYLPYKVLEKEWTKAEFKEKVTKLCDHKDRQIAEAAKLLVDSQRVKPEDDNLLWALEVKNAVTLINTELFRGGHAQRSAEYIRNDFDEYLTEDAKKLAGLPVILANIAYLHYENFSDILVPHKKEYDGFFHRTDKYHPRFVACMLRLGDLLDFDHNRFNPLSLALVKEIPETSRIHYEKHCSTGGDPSNIAPDEISVTFDCKEDVVFREAAKWKRMVEQELNNIRIHWTEILPDNFPLRLPTSDQVEIKLKFNGDENINPELMHLRFDISSKRTFEMLKGGAIYKNPGQVFLREIVQNALDATKLQIWADIEQDLPFNAKYGDREFKSKKDLKDYAFSDDIPEYIYKRYPVSLKVEYDEKKQAVTVTCEDRGTGISDESLIRMTSQVGESRKADEGYEKTIAEMPYFLQPTAAFGLGLQTVFYVADEFTVDTRCPGGNTRRIIFRTSTNGSYCSLEDENLQGWNVPHGTKVTIVVDKEHLGKLFEFGKEEYINNPEASYGYFGGLDYYAEDTFKGIEFIPFIYQSPFIQFQSGKGKEIYTFLSENGNCRLYWKQKEPVEYLIEDKDSVCQIIIMHTHNDGMYLLPIWLRDIKVSDLNQWHKPFWRISIIGLNLYSRETEQLVSLSRDRLLPQGADWCHKQIERMLPTVVQLTHKHLRKLYIEASMGDSKIRLYDQYCRLCLLNWNLSNPIEEVDLIPLDNYKERIHNNWGENQYYNIKGDYISPKEAFKATEIVAVLGIWRWFLPGNTKKIGGKDILTGYDSAIPDRYLCTQLFNIVDKDGNDSKCYRIKIGDPNSIQRIMIDDEAIQGEDVRLMLHGFDRDDYSVIVVGKDAPLLGHERPYHSNCWIYPIRYPTIIKDDIPDTRDAAEAWLREEGRMEELVPEFLVKIIMKHNILGRTKPLDNTEEFRKYKKEIHDAYICLILDTKFGFKETNEKEL